MFNARQKSRHQTLKNKEEHELPENIRYYKEDMKYYEDQLKTFAEQNNQALNNLPEDDGDFIEFEIDHKKEITYASETENVEIKTENL